MGHGAQSVAVSDGRPDVTRTRGGLRIPDQNLWTGELVDLPLTFVWDSAIGNIRLSYLDPSDDDWQHGVLWVRHGQDRAGYPRWKAINTQRTLEMMANHLCLVCSGSCVRDDGRIWWLFVEDPDVAPDGTPMTNLPPTCRACMRESLQTCPRLVERSRVVTVASTSWYAVTADLFMPSELDEMPIKAVHEVNIPLTGENASLLQVALGKQPWVLLHDLRKESTP
jgi:hypothetical protein